MAASFGKKSHRKLFKYMQKGKSATYISQKTLAPEAHYHIYGGKSNYSLHEPLLVIVRPGHYDFKCDPDTHQITVRIPIQSRVLMGGGGSAASSALSKEEQTKIQQLRATMVETVLQDRIGLTLGGDTKAQGLIILARPGGYSIVESERAYRIYLNLEDDQNPLGARLLPRGGPYVPRSTGSTMETGSSSDRSASVGLFQVSPEFSVVATYGSTDDGSSTNSGGGDRVARKHKIWKKSVSDNSASSYYGSRRSRPSEAPAGFFEVAGAATVGRAAGLEEDFGRLRLGTSRGERSGRYE